MAMNKAEREELERLKQEVALAKALRFSALPAPVLIPPPDSGTTTGWFMNSYRFGSVEQAWSESDAHGFGLKRGVQAAPGTRKLYRSYLDAIRTDFGALLDVPVHARLAPLLRERLEEIAQKPAKELSQKPKRNNGVVGKKLAEEITPAKGLDTGYTPSAKEGVSLYRSKLDAYVGLRLAKEMEFAKHLADIDAIIETVRAASSEEIAARYSMGRP